MHHDLMHATPHAQAFTASGGLFETKVDGFRALARKRGSTVEILSRIGRSMGAPSAGSSPA